MEQQVSNSVVLKKKTIMKIIKKTGEKRDEQLHRNAHGF
jgi:hypothetical protein